MNSLATANGFANEMTHSLFSLRKFLANGHSESRQHSLAIGNAMAWCNQVLYTGVLLLNQRCTQPPTSDPQGLPPLVRSLGKILLIEKENGPKRPTLAPSQNARCEGVSEFWQSFEMFSEIVGVVFKLSRK